jgi:hypothetical protein
MVRDKLLEALIDKLPEPGTPWPHEDRASWLNLMKAAFDLVYGREGAPALHIVGHPGPIELPKLPLVGDDLPELASPKAWHVDAGGIARSPEGDEAPLEGVPRGTWLVDLRTEGAGRFDTIIWADGTWPEPHVTQRGIKLNLDGKAAA